MVGRGSARAVARDGPESQDRAPSSHGSDGVSPYRLLHARRKLLGSLLG
jgi:hypothetical protein